MSAQDMVLSARDIAEKVHSDLRHGDVNLTVNLNTPDASDASDIIHARLDRLAAAPPVIAGELDRSP